MTVKILEGDCRTVLASLPAGSVHCCVTSPPYWGLRDYGMADQIGLEENIDGWVAEMVAVFREVRRVLRDDGTLWLNLGDSYAQGHGGSSTMGKGITIGKKNRANHVPRDRSDVDVSGWGARDHSMRNVVPGFKPKDLIGQPWMVAFALRADGWYLRQEIIWHKPNPMPESIRDRCTKAHEQVFLLSKSPRYYFDQDAIRTPFSEETKQQSFDTMDYKARDKYKMPDGWNTGSGAHGSFHPQGREKGKKNSFARESKDTAGNHGQKPQHRPEREPIEYKNGANKRSVWTVATEAFPGAHFATFPPALIEPCVAAGCPIGGVVLDPFFGAGTTGLVADRLQRDCIGIELNPEYAAIARARITGDAPLFADVA